MKNKKYRHLIVTPAFLEARRRKHEHDSSLGRIIPVNEMGLKAEKIREEGEEDERPKSWSHSQKQDGLQSKIIKGRINSRETAVSAPASSKSQREFIATRGKNSVPAGSHFQSWKIPDRIVSADIVTRNKIPPQQTSPQKEGIKSQRRIEKTFGEGLKPKAERSQSDSPLPKIEIRKKSPALVAEKVLQKETQAYAKEWLAKSDRKDKKVAEKFFKAISSEAKEIERALPKESDRISRKLSISSESSSRTSWSSVSSSNSLTSNCVHRTSSVAWRRDSTWLKPTKSFYQTWHGLKIQPWKNNDINFSSVYMRPHKKLNPSFIIHPEWGCKA